MAEKGGIYVLDEPTTGLHLTDVEHLAQAARPADGRRPVRDRDRAPPGGDGAADHPDAASSRDNLANVACQGPVLAR
jgi:hypothetical protein